MIRILLFFIAIALAAAGLTWLGGIKGDVSLNIEGEQWQFSILQAFVALILLVGTMIITWAIFKGIVTAPGRISKGVKTRRENKSLEALNQGLIAANAGDAKQAKKLAKKASRTVKHQPMSAVLRAQAAELSGDRAGARRIYESMLESPDTELMGLRGLYDEARRVNELIAARQFAKRALEINPSLLWAIEAMLEIHSRSGEWHDARAMLKSATFNGLVDKKTAKRHRSVLLAAEAMELEVDDANEALKLALEAHGLAPDLVPAAEVSGRILASQGKAIKAAKIISKTWEFSPHPDLALVHAHARPGDAAQDRLKRVKQLAAKRPNSIESPIAVAKTAIEAQNWKEARASLEPLLEDNPPARVCTMMAQIESGEYGDKGRVREWLARAVRAPKDPVWIAEGFISEHWLPVSPVTGKLDAFVWESPKESASVLEQNRIALEEINRTAGLLDDGVKDVELDEDKPEKTVEKDSVSKTGSAAATAAATTATTSTVSTTTTSSPSKKDLKPEAEDAEIVEEAPKKEEKTETKADAKVAVTPVTASFVKKTEEKPEEETKKAPKPETQTEAKKKAAAKVEKPTPKTEKKPEVKSEKASDKPKVEDAPVIVTKPTVKSNASGKSKPEETSPKDKEKNDDAVIFVAPRAPDDPGPAPEDVPTDKKISLDDRFRSSTK